MKRSTNPTNDFLSILGGRAGVVATGVTASRPWDAVVPLVRRMIQSNARRSQLRHLAELEPYLLEDIGVTRGQVLDELRKG